MPCRQPLGWAGFPGPSLRMWKLRPRAACPGPLTGQPGGHLWSSQKALAPSAMGLIQASPCRPFLRALVLVGSSSVRAALSRQHILGGHHGRSALVTPPSVPPAPSPTTQPRVWTCSCRPAAGVLSTAGSLPTLLQHRTQAAVSPAPAHPCRRAAPPPGGPVQPRPRLLRLRLPCWPSAAAAVCGDPAATSAGAAPSLPARLRRHRHGPGPTSSTAAATFRTEEGCSRPSAKLRVGSGGPHGGGGWMTGWMNRTCVRRAVPGGPGGGPGCRGQAGRGRGWGPESWMALLRPSQNCRALAWGACLS